jgi:hypothetical protein
LLWPEREQLAEAELILIISAGLSFSAKNTAFIFIQLYRLAFIDRLE